MNEESKIFGMTVRGFLVILLTLTVCLLSGLSHKIDEPLYSAFMLALGFYFGQKTTGGSNDSKGNIKSDISGGPTSNIG